MKLTNWRDDLRELGFGNQVVIVGTKRRELFDEIEKLLVDERKKTPKEAFEYGVSVGRKELKAELRNLLDVDKAQL